MIRLNKAGTTLELKDKLNFATLQEIVEKQNEIKHSPQDVIMWAHTGKVFVKEDNVSYRIKLDITDDFQVTIKGIEIENDDQGPEDILRAVLERLMS